MNCEEIRDLLALHVGGEAHENERIALEAHLPSCAECRCALDEYRELRQAMADLKEGSAPRGAIESTWTRVQQEIAPAKKGGRVMAMEWLIRAAAVVVIGVAIGYSSMQVAAQRTPAAAKSVAETPSTEYAPGARPREAGGGAGPWGGGAPPMQINPNVRRNTTKLQGNYYLPRVERILDGDECEF
jgi:anti-sigma factor RsiW